MRFEQLQYFVEVVNCGSITKASKRLYLSQPALSAALAAFERELGAPLLTRSAQGVVPTEFGLKILEDSKTILALTADWKQNRQSPAHAQGEFHIMALPPDCSFLMKRLIPRLMDLYPKLSVFIHEATTRQVLSALPKNKADVYISCYTPDEKEKTLSIAERAGYQTAALLEDELQIFISCQNPLADRAYLTQEDCSSLTLARYTDHNDHVSYQFSSQFSPNTQIRLSSRENTLQLIAQDKAVAYYPIKITSVSQYVVNGEIKAIPIQGLTLPTTHFIAFPPTPDKDRLSYHIVNAIQECYHSMNDPS